MTQLEQDDEKAEIISLLKIDDKGWEVKLFEDRIKLSACVCVHCSCICCDAVELGCDHNDNDIYLYCYGCLKQLINDNDNKCPINGHIDPVITPNRASRRQISKATVLCPYSATYKAINNNNNNNDNGHLIDTMGGDEKEGNQNIAQYKENNIKNKEDGCQYKGTLDDLINNHLISCAMKQNPSFALNIKINKLKNENNALNKQILTLRQELQSVSIKQRNENNELNQKNLTLKNDINNKDEIIITLQNEINSLKLENKELKHQLNAQSVLMQDIMDNNNQEETKNNDDHHINQTMTEQFQFDIPQNSKDLLTKIDKNKLLWKGSWGTNRWCKFGRLLHQNDNVTVYFDAGSVGAFSYYRFGFVTAKCKGWDNMWPAHIAGLDGEATYKIKHEFYGINNKQAIEQKCKSMKLMDQTSDKNIVAMSVDMKQKIGWVWNDNNKECKVEFKLPGPVFFAVCLGGSDKKTLSVINVIIK